MKKYFIPIFAALILFQVAIAQPSPLSASDILKDAQSIAAKENKKVFIIFHASWCVWCHKMDTSMNDPVCKKFFDDNFVIRHLVVSESPDKKNLENPGAEEMKTKYHGEEQGIPFWLIFDQKGNLLVDSKIRSAGEGPQAGDNSGCPASEKEVAFFVKMLKQTTNLNDKELEIIAKRFRKNE